MELQQNIGNSLLGGFLQEPQPPMLGLLKIVSQFLYERMREGRFFLPQFLQKFLRNRTNMNIGESGGTILLGRPRQGSPVAEGFPWSCQAQKLCASVGRKSFQLHQSALKAVDSKRLVALQEKSLTCPEIPADTILVHSINNIATQAGKETFPLPSVKATLTIHIHCSS